MTNNHNTFRILISLLLLIFCLNLQAKPLLPPEIWALIERARIDGNPDEKVDDRYLVVRSQSPNPEFFKISTPDGVDLGMSYAGNPHSEADKPIVLFIHGLTGHKNNWFNESPEMSSLLELVWRAGFETATMNYRGHGEADLRSMAPGPKRKSLLNPLFYLDYLSLRKYVPGKGFGGVPGSTFYSLDRMPLDVITAVEYFRELTGRKVIIVGHSLGEVVAEWVLSGVRYNLDKKQSEVLPDEEARRWVVENMHSHKVSSRLVRVVFKDGRSVKVTEKNRSTLDIHRIKELHYRGGEVIADFHPDRKRYRINAYNNVYPEFQRGGLRQNIRYTINPALIGVGGATESRPIFAESFHQSNGNETRALRTFLTLYGPFLNWIATPNKNQTWYHDVTTLPLAKMFTGIPRHLWNFTSDKTHEAGKEMAFELFYQIIHRNKFVEHRLSRLVMELVGTPEDFSGSRADLKAILREGFVLPEFGVLLQFLHLVAGEYQSRDGKVNYSRRRIFAHTLMVRSLGDFFTPLDHVMRRLVLLGNQAKLAIMGGGHIAQIHENKRPALFRTIMEYLKNPRTPDLPSGREVSPSFMCKGLFAG